MSIYQRFDVRPFINAVGPWTAYGGATMSKRVMEAMDEAAKEAVRMDELQAAASKIIAEITHAEAGIVTAGASAALTLGTAACLAGYDVAKMNRLPDTEGMPNEVIKPWHQITSYDHAIRAAGGKIIGVGLAKAFTPAHEQHMISPWEIEAKITEKTAVIAYTASQGNHPPLEEVTELGRRYKIPVIVDAAPHVPPIENLHRFIDMGADLVCISGGKGICGPQASGILCGRRDLIASAALQMLDIVGSFEKWNPPPSFISKEKLRVVPERGIGRGMKVSREAIVGLLVALEELTEDKFATRVKGMTNILMVMKRCIEDIAGVEARMVEDDPRTDPKLEVIIDEQVLGTSAVDISRKLKEGEPAVYIGETHLYRSVLSINPMNLDEETAKIVGERLYAVMTS